MQIAYYVNKLSGATGVNHYIILEEGYEWHERHVSNVNEGVNPFTPDMYLEIVKDTDIPWYGWTYWDGEVYLIPIESLSDGSDYSEGAIDYPAVNKLHKYLLTRYNPLLVYVLSYILATVFLPYMDQSVHTYLRQKVKKLIDALPG